MTAQPKVKLSKQDLSDKELSHYLSKGVIAIDCEMMGLNISRDRLCLVQIGDEDRQVVIVQIDQDQKAAPNLKQLMESTDTLKLFHFARTDVAWLKFWLDIEVQNVFCTKIASKLARTYSDKHSLKDLCKEIIGKDLNKNQQQSDWGQLEITKDQMQYAANDVFYLIGIYKKLKSMLEREGRMDLALKCSNFIPTLALIDSYGYGDVLAH